jgi:hypothetical protein
MKKADRLRRRVALCLCALALFSMPVLVASEVLHLKDGSTLKGKVVSFVADTLVFEPSVGGRMRIPKSEIVRIVYGESDALGSGEPAIDPASGASAGPGRLSIVFKDRDLSSKIAIPHNRRDRKTEFLRANWIAEYVLVGPDTVFARVDSTIEKTIYEGHDRVYKNSIELTDIDTSLVAGVYRCVIGVRNTSRSEHEAYFTEGPLNMRLIMEPVPIYAGRTTTVEVGVKHGFMRLRSPTFYRIQ